jgi:hypothetical protein
MLDLLSSYALSIPPFTPVNSKQDLAKLLAHRHVESAREPEPGPDATPVAPVPALRKPERPREFNSVRR